MSVAIYVGCASVFALAFYPIHFGYEVGWLLVLFSIWLVVFRVMVVRNNQT